MQASIQQAPRNGEIRKAVFPVGGLGTRFHPVTKSVPKEMLPVLDTPLIDHAIAEAVAAGMTECIFITGRNRAMLENHLATNNSIKPTFIDQPEPLGLGHAIWCARDCVEDDEAVAIILPDDFIRPANTMTEMVAAWRETGGTMLAAMQVARDEVSSYGIIGIDGDIAKGDTAKVTSLVEKPAPENTPSNLAVIGRYIIEHGVFTELEKQERGAGGEIQITDSIARRIGVSGVHTLAITGTRYDCGSKAGFLKANIAMGLGNKEFGTALKDWIKAEIAGT